MSTQTGVTTDEIALDVVKDPRSKLVEEREEFRKWCLDNISMKECSCFVPAASHSQQRCACGLLRSRHKEATSDDSSEWSSNQHTREIPTDAFGWVSFSEEQQDDGISAEYIRLSDNTSVDRLWYMMKHYWSLKPPTLIVSVVGGNRDGTINVEVKKALEEGFAKVINQTDVWLLTGATGTPITNLVSKAFKENRKHDRWEKNACIGIFPWGRIPENDSLVGEMADVIYSPSNSMLAEGEKLQENHTHFLLVDNGTSRKFGTEREFRVKFERFLCNPLDSKAIPSVNLLVHGGYHASKQIKENLHGHPNIPTVIVKGSGGLADAIANAFKAATGGRKGLSLLNWIEGDLSKFATLKDNTKAEIAQIRGVIKEIVEEHSNKVSIYDPKGDPYGLDHAIMDACKSCSAGTLDIFNRLQLAMHLGKVEAVTRDIQEHGADDNTLYKSIKRGKATFVELLLSHGVNLHSFLKDRQMIERLYKNKIKHKTILVSLLECADQNKFQLQDVDTLLDDLLDGDYTRYYVPESNKNAKVAMTPAQELIIWAVLNDMTDIVECFWKFDTEKALENALIIFRLYKAISKLSEFDDIQRADLMSVATKYETRAVELLAWYYKQNPKTSVDVVATRITLWGYKNLVTLAANGKSREFVAHTCCQEYLKDAWLGRSDKKTLKSEVWKLKRNLLHPRRRLASTSALYRLMKLGKLTEKDGQNDPLPSRCQRIITRIKSSFRFLFFVPKGKLFVHQFIFTLFLGCFAYFVLVKKGIYHDTLRYVVFTMVTALTIDEIREISGVRKRTLYLKLKEWKRSGWNRLDFLAMLLFYVGFILGSQGLASAERAIMAADLVLWVIKFVQFYRMFYTLGPYLIMINKMMFHMVGFVLVLIVAVIAYGIFMHTLLFPDVSVSWDIVFKLLFRPYLLVFGELGIASYTLSTKSTVYGTKKVSEATEIIVVLGMCIYLLVANVLLLNMLIAVFNNIYDEVKNHSDKIWRFDKYDMIMEYKRKPMLPIPFSILTNVPMILLHMFRDERRTEFHRDSSDHAIDMKDFQLRSTRAFFRECGEKPTIDEKLELINERTDNISKSVSELEERMEANFVKLSRKTRNVKV